MGIYEQILQKQHYKFNTFNLLSTLYIAVKAFYLTMDSIPFLLNSILCNQQLINNKNTSFSFNGNYMMIKTMIYSYALFVDLVIFKVRSLPIQLENCLFSLT